MVHGVPVSDGPGVTGSLTGDDPADNVPFFEPRGKSGRDLEEVDRLVFDSEHHSDSGQSGSNRLSISQSKIS